MFKGEMLKWRLPLQGCEVLVGAAEAESMGE